MRLRSMALAAIVAGSLMVIPGRAHAAPTVRRPARPAAPAAVASAPPPTFAMPSRVSPYAVVARQHAQAASGPAHAPSVPPSMRRTRQPIGQQSR